MILEIRLLVLEATEVSHTLLTTLQVSGRTPIYW